MRFAFPGLAPKDVKKDDNLRKNRRKFAVFPSPASTSVFSLPPPETIPVRLMITTFVPVT